MATEISEDHAYVIEIETSKGHWFEEERFAYMGIDKKYSCRNTAFLAAKKKIKDLRVKYTDQTYRLTFEKMSVVLIDI